MTTEDKNLLLKDLCARVPYHPKGHVVNACNGAECDEWLTCATFSMFTNITNNCHLYLRLMSSMTEKEIKELLNIDTKRGIFSSRHLTWHLDGEVVDYLNRHHFDYRGLIERGIALEAPEGMYTDDKFVLITKEELEKTRISSKDYLI